MAHFLIYASFCALLIVVSHIIYKELSAGIKRVF